jgi:hypothetical protein
MTKDEALCCYRVAENGYNAAVARWGDQSPEAMTASEFVQSLIFDMVATGVGCDDMERETEALKRPVATEGA